MTDRAFESPFPFAVPGKAGSLIAGDGCEAGQSFDAVTAQSGLFPFITVVVPVRNEARFIARTIEQLVAQDYPCDRFEILVVDGRSVDETRSVTESVAAVHSNVKVLDNPRYLSRVRRENIGVRLARGRIDRHRGWPLRAGRDAITFAPWPMLFSERERIVWAGRSRATWRGHRDSSGRLPRPGLHG